MKKNNLKTLRPDLTREWHPTKNGDLTPEKSMPGSGKRVWWKCPQGDDHEWKTSIGHRARKDGTGCPHCWAIRNRKLKKK